MDARILAATILLEILLVATRLLATWLKDNDKYGATQKFATKWELLPYDFSKVDWYLRHRIEKEETPKVRDPQSRDV